MTPTPHVIESLKDLLAAANPGLATKEDLARLEDRVDELTELVDSLARELGRIASNPDRGGPAGAGQG